MELNGTVNSSAAGGFLRGKCAICFESLRGKACCVTSCGHAYCVACITDNLSYEWVPSGKRVKESGICPRCQKKFLKTRLRKIYL
ncbi:uncharacterized protein [Euwallacea similis]|uniref:uncharacterized protein n=1 Tax=Euwallacea similis TaxID=1736056 RepID=UPI00344FD7F2